MNNSQIYNLPRIVVDTNVLFMALYNLHGKAGQIIDLATEDKLTLFSTDTVRMELVRVLKRELKLTNEEIKINIEKLPVFWMGEEVYVKYIEKATVKHKPDKPVEALAIALNCGLLSADLDFKKCKRRIDIDKLLEKLK